MSSDKTGFSALWRPAKPIIDRAVVKLFPLYKPYSSGRSAAKAMLTVRAINEMPQALLNLSQVLQREPAPTITLDDYRPEVFTSERKALKALFDKHGSDKSGHHNYHLAYGALLGDQAGVRKLFEVGLGSNNRDVVSNMGRHGRPGASLRAFRDFLPNAQIHGADIDRRVLFTDDRINTHFIDQMDVSSFTALADAIGGDFDLMIDDGLHAPTANLNSLGFFLPRIRSGGWAVIEDIGFAAEPLWKFVSTLLPQGYEATIFRARLALMFAVQRTA